MARKQQTIKPLVDVMHDYAAALKETQDAMSLLFSFCTSLADSGPTIIHPEFQKRLKTHCDNYRRAMYGDAS